MKADVSEEDATAFNQLMESLVAPFQAERIAGERTLGDYTKTPESLVKLMSLVCNALQTQLVFEMISNTALIMKNFFIPNRGILTAEQRKITNQLVLAVISDPLNCVYQHRQVFMMLSIELIPRMYFQDSVLFSTDGWPELDQFFLSKIPRANAEPRMCSFVHYAAFKIMHLMPARSCHIYYRALLDDTLTNTDLFKGVEKVGQPASSTRPGDHRYLYRKWLADVILLAPDYDPQYFEEFPDIKERLWDILCAVPAPEDRNPDNYEALMVFYAMMNMFGKPGVLSQLERIIGAKSMQELVQKYLAVIEKLFEPPLADDDLHRLLAALIAINSFLQPNKLVSSNENLIVKVFECLFELVFTNGDPDESPFSQFPVTLADVSRMVDSKLVSSEVLESFFRSKDESLTQHFLVEFLLYARVGPNGKEATSDLLNLGPNKRGDVDRDYVITMLARLCEINPDYLNEVPWALIANLEFFGPHLQSLLSDRFGSGNISRYVPFSLIWCRESLADLKPGDENSEDSYSLTEIPEWYNNDMLMRFLFTHHFVLSDSDDEVDLKHLVDERPLKSLDEKKIFKITAASYEILHSFLLEQIGENTTDIELICRLVSLINHGWTKETHRFFPRESRDLLFQILLVRQHSLMGLLPDELFFGIISDAVFHNYKFNELLGYNCSTFADYKRIVGIYEKYPDFAFYCKFKLSLMK